ncbi:energy-coupling factor ABC transporter permease [Chlorobium phaeobacteroides]|uniref:Cobalamin (Vitamin B12) biosynthesis CbiM protein n=1 Tax=Chlorobium phaeobacteroides (strain DSM 266 / SMG 266 / 2430) TaxID=290317 RepID=A1BDR6_CHLPD|nr:energy-coupling factor ABC transporter permease [Chlorobium phaeobacteroides]ABL64543.1 cobalamin (vitamin B12) biosynthesis CbiM protein [Chlorobium phaeobacteroides DSM 266]
MHMSDALLSPIVGGAFWIISGTLIGYSAKKIIEENDHAKTPLMGVMGAFIFAAQMINFSIPGTGSSGHLGGGLLLAALLGPYRAFITLSSVLIIQSLFFGDGGLLALGCNMFNLAYFPAFLAYPLIFRKIIGNNPSQQRLAAGSISAAIAGLLMGAFSVVIETVLSGISELPFGSFMLFMMPIHLAIGIVEGLVTWAVLSFVAKTDPALLPSNQNAARPRAAILGVLTIAALLTGGVLSWFASSSPDGLEWSISRTSGSEELLNRGEPIHELLGSIQEKTAFLPDYSFKTADATSPSGDSPVNPAATVSGLAGSFSVLIMAGLAGLILAKKRTRGNH